MKFLYIKNIRLIAVIMFFLLDRFLKFLAIKGYEFDILKKIFYFSFTPNYFISFSLPLTGPLLTIGIALILIMLLIKLSQMIIAKHTNIMFVLLFALISGGVSNFIDRIYYGFVVDYLNLQYFTVFNIADIMIVVSVLILIFLYQKHPSS